MSATDDEIAATAARIRDHGARGQTGARAADMLETLLVRAKAAEEQSDALLSKVNSLSAHETCGCAYDRRNDLCAHHSPKLSAARATIEDLTKDRNRLIDEQSDTLNWLVISEAMLKTAYATIEALQSALEPFDRACEFMTSDYESDLDPVTKADRVVIEVGHLRRARDTLRSSRTEGEV